MKNNGSFKRYSLSLVWCWLALFALVPLLLVSIPSVLHPDNEHFMRWPPTFSNYRQLFNGAYLRISLQSLYLASSCVILCLLLGYPFSYLIARSKSRYKSLLLLLVIIPFWTSTMIRTYAIMALLKAKGMLNGL